MYSDRWGSVSPVRTENAAAADIPLTLINATSLIGRLVPEPFAFLYPARMQLTLRPEFSH